MRVDRSDSTPLDFCDKCAPTEAEAEAKYSHGKDGPDGRGNCFAYDCWHPQYSEVGDYRCAGCGKILMEPPCSSGIYAVVSGKNKPPAGYTFSTY